MRELDHIKVMTSTARRKVLVAAAVVGLTLITAIHLQYVRGVQREERAALQYNAAILSDRLAGRILAMIHTVKGLAAFLTSEPALPDSNAFDHFARKLLRMRPTLRALQIVNTNGVITHQLPVEGNEAAQGLDLKTLPDWTFLEEARRSRKTIVNPNPFRLVQGPPGVIIRTPLYRNDAFLGWAQGVYNVEDLLHGLERQLPSHLYHLTMQLEASDGKVFLGSKTIPDTALRTSIKVDGQMWKLRVALNEPGRRISSVVLASIWGGGLLLLGMVLWGLRAGWWKAELLNLTVQKRTSQLELSEKRFRDIFKRAPVSIWEEDFSAVGEWLAALRRSGIQDLHAFLQSEPQALRRALSLVNLVEVNEITLRLWEVRSKEELLDRWTEMFTDETYDVFMEELLAIWEGRNEVIYQCSAKTATGRPIQYEMHWVAPMVKGQMNLSQVIVAIIDLTVLNENKELLRKNEKNLRLAGQISKIGYWSRELKYDEITWSAETCRIFGLEPKTAAFKLDALFDYIHPEDRKMVDQAIQEAVAATQPYDVEYRGLRPDGTFRWVHSKGEVDLDQHGQPKRMFGIVQDITGRKRAEEALRESEERYRSFVEDQIDLVNRIKPDGTILFANTGYCNFFGISKEAVVGTNWHPKAHPDDLWMIDEQLSRLCPENPIVTIENRVFDANDQIRWVQFSNRALFDENGVIQEIQSVGRDITERKRAEKELNRRTWELSSLAARFASSEEETRKAVAAEIHDDLGQRLTAIGLALNSALTRLSRGSGDACEPLRDARTELERITDSTRAIVDGLRPPNLDEYGLAAAIRWHADRFERSTGIPITLNVPDLSRRLPAKAEIGMFRILQEALNNVVRHAQAGSVSINLTEDGPRISLKIVDDGTGFDSTRSVGLSSSGHGLISMRERALAIGGSLRLYSRPGQGTEVQVEIGQNE